MAADIPSSDILMNRWNALKAENPRLKIREAAQSLGTSEATLLSLQLGSTVRRLRCEPNALLSRLEALGTLMALTRNDAVVHERHGVYRNVQVTGNVGLIANPDIDLRLDFSVWALAFAETKDHAGKVLRSFQFFDRQGEALHKVFLENGTPEQVQLYESLVEDFLAVDQVTVFFAEGVNPPDREVVAESPDLKRDLLEAWGKIQDPHHFHGLLRKNRVSRTRALELAEGVFTRRIDLQAVDALLGNAARDAIPIMVFVANRGCVQIHTGTVTNIRPLGAWRNVLDPEFNLHFDLSLADKAWVVTKPSESGAVTSIEFYSASGELLVQFFGKRKPGQEELSAWRDLVGTLS